MRLQTLAKRVWDSRWGQFACVMAALTLGAGLVWVIAARANHSLAYWYLLWNLFLAWVPFVLGAALVFTARRYGWQSLQSFAMFVLWLFFLPNTFYMLTDYVHLQEFVRSNVMLDVVMFTLFVLNGLALGFSSVLMVHRAVVQKVSGRVIGIGLAALFLLSSLAMYLGRELRWNSWDVVSNPFGIVFNVSDLIIHPGAHPQAFEMILLFFGFLAVMYFAVWRIAGIVQK